MSVSVTGHFSINYQGHRKSSTVHLTWQFLTKHCAASRSANRTHFNPLVHLLFLQKSWDHIFQNFFIHKSFLKIYTSHVLKCLSKDIPHLFNIFTKSVHFLTITSFKISHIIWILLVLFKPKEKINFFIVTKPEAPHNTANISFALFPNFTQN